MKNPRDHINNRKNQNVFINILFYFPNELLFVVLFFSISTYATEQTQHTSSRTAIQNETPYENQFLLVECLLECG